MSMKAIKDIYLVTKSLGPAAYTSTQTGTAIDLADINENEVALVPGTWTDGTFAPKLTESADNTTYNDVTAADQVGTFANVTGTASATVQRVSYIGSKRYIKPVITVTGSPTTGMVFGVQAITRARKQP